MSNAKLLSKQMLHLTRTQEQITRIVEQLRQYVETFKPVATYIHMVFDLSSKRWPSVCPLSVGPLPGLGPQKHFCLCGFRFWPPVPLTLRAEPDDWGER